MSVNAYIPFWMADEAGEPVQVLIPRGNIIIVSRKRTIRSDRTRTLKSHRKRTIKAAT